jgi:Holliday junction resolvasome RuvABC endonuclease subunit
MFTTDKKILALDLSLTSTGVCTTLDGEISTYRLAPKKEIKGFARLAWFNTRIYEALGKGNYDCIVIENYAMGVGRGGRAFSIGELGGVVRLAVFHSGIKCFLVPPTTLKKFITGNGGSDKSVVSKELYKRYGVDLNNDDEVDAACLAIMGSYLYDNQSEDELFDYQRDALSKVEEVISVRPR